MFRMNPTEMKRMLKRMGISADIEEINDAERVLIERTGSKNMIIEDPVITILKMKGESVLYIYGTIKEISKEEKHISRPQIPEEDVQLVASEAGVSMDEARKALEATGGDIAQAIMLLQSRK
ncbi:MAG: nascent polypeptide-associated complex protein [Fervidicoccaceae archaeon]